MFRLAILLDNCYYTLYYCMDVNARAFNTTSPVFSPKEYFTTKIVTPETTALQNQTLKEYLERSVSEAGRAQLSDVWGNLLPFNSSHTGASDKASKVKNPLLDVYVVPALVHIYQHT